MKHLNFTNRISSGMIAIASVSVLIGCSDKDPHIRQWSLAGSLIEEESGLRPGEIFTLPPLMTIGGDQETLETRLTLINQTGLERRLDRVLKGCGCTTVEYASTVIANGGKLEFQVRVTTAGLESLEGRLITFRPIFEDGNQLSFEQRIFNLPSILEHVAGHRRSGAMLSPCSIAPGAMFEDSKDVLLLSKQENSLPVDLSVRASPAAIDATIKQTGPPIAIEEYAGERVIAIPHRLSLQSSKEIKHDLAYTVSFLEGKETFAVCSGKVIVQNVFTVQPQELILKDRKKLFFSVINRAGHRFKVESLESDQQLLSFTQKTEGEQTCHDFLVEENLGSSLLRSSFIETEVSIRTVLGETVSLNVVLLPPPTGD